MTNVDLTNMDVNPLLFAVVKILSDNGLKKTLKKLRKETKCKKLKEKYLPDEFRNADYHKIVSRLLKKKIKKQKRELNGTNNVEKPKEESKVLNGFVKSSKILEGTIETPKAPESVSITDSTDTLTTLNSKSDEKKKGIPFKRIDDEVWLNRIDKEELKVNSYRRNGDGFVSKDAEQLGSVKGKDFRSQKYKRKRSSWRGSGEITNSVNSVFFSDSDS